MATYSRDTIPEVHRELYDELMKRVIKEGLINQGRTFTKENGEVIDYSVLTRCWDKTNSGPYGQFNYKGISYANHRLSFWLHNGQPDMTNRKWVVGHDCDNQRCCNPDHLQYIPQQQNVGDGVKRIRQIKPPAEPTRAVVACNTCRADRHHACIGFPCSLCVSKKIECVKEEFKPTSGSFTTAQTSGENNANAKLTGEQVLEIRTRIQKGLKYGELKKMAEDYGISYVTIQAIKSGRVWSQPEYFPKP